MPQPKTKNGRKAKLAQPKSNAHHVPSGAPVRVLEKGKMGFNSIHNPNRGAARIAHAACGEREYIVTAPRHLSDVRLFGKSEGPKSVEYATGRAIGRSDVFHPDANPYGTRRFSVEDASALTRQEADFARREMGDLRDDEPDYADTVPVGD